MVSLLKKSLSSSKVDGHIDRVFAIANHPTNAHEFVSSGWDNTLQVSNICLLIQSVIVIVYIFQPKKLNNICFACSSSGMFDVRILFDLYMEYLSAERVYRLIKEVKN